MRRSCSIASPRPARPKDRAPPACCWPSAGWPTTRTPSRSTTRGRGSELLAARPAETERGSGDGWSDLPGTLQELDAVTRLAATRDVVRLQGAEAGTARLLQELPRARWAHIATHGFFADPSVRSVLTPDPRLFASMGTRADRRRPAQPAGPLRASCSPGPTGRKARTTALAHDDRGILTAEAIAGLPLQDLELVVLSACETGLGTGSAAARASSASSAFHLAGAHNVVASLWKVDDQATAALMALFYDRLWRQNKPPIEALREAQLMLYRHPELVGPARQGPRHARLRQAGPASRAGRRQRGAGAEGPRPGEAMGRVRPLGMGKVRARMRNRREHPTTTAMPDWSPSW